MQQWRIREPQHLLLASLATIDRLGNATGKLDDDLPLHWIAIVFGDD